MREKAGIKGLECTLRKSGPMVVTCPALETCITKVHELHRRLETSLKLELQPVCDSALGTAEPDSRGMD
jgi:hypothetical protein